MQALTPAMDQWRKRIGQIAINFEASHKAEGKSSKSVKAAQSDLKLSEVSSSKPERSFLSCNMCCVPLWSLADCCVAQQTCGASVVICA